MELDQRTIAGGFLVVSALVFGVAVWPHLREPPQEVDVEGIFAHESPFHQLVVANVALGLCAATISKTADVIEAYQQEKDVMSELR